MELKLEDYAKRIDRFYYEIMREYADDAPTTKDLEIFIRPSSGYLDVWRFVLQDNGIKSGFDFKHSLKGEDCFVSRDVWNNLAKNPDPPWLFPKTSIDAVDRLHLVPSFIDLNYLPKNETESYKFGMLESVKIYLSNIWVREKKIESSSLIKPKGNRCILWKDDAEKLSLLAKLLSEYNFIDKASIWLEHFNTDPLERKDALTIKWGKNKYELYYLLRNLNNLEIRESYSNHFEGIKEPPWSGNKPTEKLDTIKAILKQVN